MDDFASESERARAATPRAARGAHARARARCDPRPRCSSIQAGTTRPKKPREARVTQQAEPEAPKLRKEKIGGIAPKRTRAEYHAMLAEAARNTVDQE